MTDQSHVEISQLSLFSSDFIIKGRVTSRTLVREFKNAKGRGNLFSFCLADKSGEIKVTAFNAECDRHSPSIELNKVYEVCKATIKIADKRFTSAEYELTLNSRSIVQEVTGKTSLRDVPSIKYNFMSIASLNDAPVNKLVDVLGVIITISSLLTSIDKASNELKRRTIDVVDRSRHAIKLTIWADQASNFNGQVGDVIILRDSRISLFGGRSISSVSSFVVNPKLPESDKLKKWFDNLLDNNFISLTTVVSRSDTAEFRNLIDYVAPNPACLYSNCRVFKCIAMIVGIGKNYPLYRACKNANCGKKLVEIGTNEYKCEKCSKETTDFKFRFKFDFQIKDSSSSCWVTAWDERAELLIGTKAQDFGELMMVDRKAAEQSLSDIIRKTYEFALEARKDSFNGNERVRFNVISIKRI